MGNMGAFFYLYFLSLPLLLDYYSVNKPFAFDSFNTEEMPLLLIVLIAVVETFNRAYQKGLFTASVNEKKLIIPKNRPQVA